MNLRSLDKEIQLLEDTKLMLWIAVIAMYMMHKGGNN